MVDGGHQRGRRAVVGGQQVVPAGGGLAHAEVAVDVGAAKAVNRLLGVADQQQRGGGVVVGDAVEPVEDARLQRRGVLKLIDQRHRVLGQDTPAQPVGCLAVDAGVGLGAQRAVQPGQQVGKAKRAGLLLEHGQALGDLRCRMQAQRAGQRRQLADGRHELGKSLEIIRQRDAGAGFQCRHHAVRGEAGFALFQIRPGRVVRLGPGRQTAQPDAVVARRQLFFVERARFGGQCVVQPTLHGQRALRPAGFEGPDVSAAPGRQAGDQLSQAALAGAAGHGLRQQLAGVVGQCLDAAPGGQRRVPGRARQRVDLGPPVVAGGLVGHGALVGVEFFVEQAAAVEGVLAQHALAPGVDGVHRRVVHALGGQAQPPRGGAARGGLGVVGQQIGQKRVGRAGRGFTAKAARGLQQA